MSAVEIADNQWELQSTKPPVTSPGGIAQILLMGGFALFFVYVIVMSIVAIASPKKDTGLGATYENLNAAGAQKAEEAPAPAE